MQLNPVTYNWKTEAPGTPEHTGFIARPVLRGFSFALVVGIVIGTYSSIAVAAPMLVAWQDWRAKKGKATVLPAAKRGRA